MRKNLAKNLCVLTMTAALSASVIGCGSKTTEATTAAATETTVAAEATTAAMDETTAAKEETTAAKEETKAEAKATGDALAEEEYIAKTTELGTALTETMTKAQEELAALDPSDIEGAKKLIEGMKAPFLDMAAVQAPEKYAAAQAKYKTGCEAMADYLDLCVEMMDMQAGGKTPSEAEVTELTTKLTTLLTTVQTDLTEAATLMAQASAQ